MAILITLAVIHLLQAFSNSLLYIIVHQLTVISVFWTQFIATGLSVKQAMYWAADYFLTVFRLGDLSGCITPIFWRNIGVAASFGAYSGNLYTLLSFITLAFQNRLLIAKLMEED